MTVLYTAVSPVTSTWLAHNKFSKISAFTLAHNKCSVSILYDWFHVDKSQCKGNNVLKALYLKTLMSDNLDEKSLSWEGGQMCKSETMQLEENIWECLPSSCYFLKKLSVAQCL